MRGAITFTAAVICFAYGVAAAAGGCVVLLAIIFSRVRNWALKVEDSCGWWCRLLEIGVITALTLGVLTACALAVASLSVAFGR